MLVLGQDILCPESYKAYYEHIIPEFPIGHLVQIYNRIDRSAMRLCYQEAVSYYSSVIVGKPYRTILRGSTGYGGSLLSPHKPCVEHAHRIVGWRKRLITEQTSSEFHCLC